MSVGGNMATVRAVHVVKKMCNRCKEEKSLAEFYRRGDDYWSDGYRTICKVCDRQRCRNNYWIRKAKK